MTIQEDSGQIQLIKVTERRLAETARRLYAQDRSVGLLIVIIKMKSRLTSD